MPVGRHRRLSRERRTEGMQTQATTRIPERGFTLVELMIVTVILGILAAVASEVYTGIMSSAEATAMAVEAREVYLEFESYYVDHGRYPNATSDPAFDLATFEPLDYGGAILSRLAGGSADCYDSPDDEGANQEFWLEMTMEGQPGIRVLVAHADAYSDGANGTCTISGSGRFDGVYLFEDGELRTSY